MKKTYIVSIFIVLTVIFSNICVSFASPLEINAASCILMDSKTGQVLYASNPDDKLWPASTTKMMTAIVAIDLAKEKFSDKLDHPMYVSAAAIEDIGPGGMNVGIMAGEILTFRDLLNVLLVRSANETANIIAENVICTQEELSALSIQETREKRKEFVALMNQKAVELGAVNTNFVNPCGMDVKAADASHLSSSRDLALIARYGMQLPEFREIVGKTIYDMPETNKHKVYDATLKKLPSDMWYPLATTNQLLWDPNSYQYTIHGEEKKYVVNGVKTGYTERAGNNLVSSAVNEEGMELIGVIMGVKNQMAKSVFNHTKTLMRYGFENFALQKFSEANVHVKNVSVTDAKDGKTLDLITAAELKAVLPINSTEWDIQKTEIITPSIQAPVQKGDTLGYIEYTRKGISLGRVDIIAADTVEKIPTIKEQTVETARTLVSNNLIRNTIIFCAVSLVIFIILRVTLRKISRAVRARKTRRIG
jgi:serine-type D-Ala-D-Ala carboxypeptidase (penicillin-binding protein 5/6)